MTFEDDFVQIGGVRVTLVKLGLEWPPPPFMCIRNHGELPDLYVKQESCSQITDEQRAGMTHVCRGALYKPCYPDEIPSTQ